MSAQPTAENDAPRLANACNDCGDCYHPVIGPNTDGEPCEWCRDCGCHADDHTRMTRVLPPGEIDRCICDPAGPCLGAEHDTGGTIECKACLVLDPELPCLNDPEVTL